MTKNKYARAAESLRDINDALKLLDLAAQLPEGEAERVLREAIKRKANERPFKVEMFNGRDWVRIGSGHKSHEAARRRVLTEAAVSKRWEAGRVSFNGESIDLVMERES